MVALLHELDLNIEHLEICLQLIAGTEIKHFVDHCAGAQGVVAAMQLTQLVPLLGDKERSFFFVGIQQLLFDIAPVLQTLDNDTDGAACAAPVLGQFHAENARMFINILQNVGIQHFDQFAVSIIHIVGYSVILHCRETEFQVTAVGKLAYNIRYTALIFHCVPLYKFFHNIPSAIFHKSKATYI